MIQRIGRKRFSLYAFDVESHNDEESIKNNETSVWLYSFINDESKIDDAESYGYDLDHFMETIERLSTHPRTTDKRPINNLMIFIYNMSFEYSFLLPYFIKWGFKWKDEIENDDEMVFNAVTTKTASSVWQIQLKFHKKSGIIIFHDMCKIFPGGLRTVAKSFNLPTQKGDIDYTLNRLHGYHVTDEERAYCFKDTRILIDILLEMQRKDDKFFFKSLTIASYACKTMLKVGFPHAYKPHKAFRKYYPELGEEESAFLRNSVAGGITYAPSLWQFKDINQEVTHIDGHQMHPTQAFKHLFPCGYGTYFKGAPAYHGAQMCCCHIRVSYSGVRLHSVIRLIGIDIADDIELTVWDFEIPTMRKCYIDLKIEYIDGYAYKARFLPWRTFFSHNYELRLIAKKNNDAFGINQYKRMNNAAGFGKHIEKGKTTEFINYIDENGLIDSKEVPCKHPNINATYTYIPIGSAIPAYSRVTLIETALRFGWKNVVYFDTDSIFMIKNKETDDELKKLDTTDFLGGWSVEPRIKRAQFSAPKRYKLEEEIDGKDETTIHMAGINFKSLAKGCSMPTYEDLDVIRGDYDIQGIKRCKGGTLIIMKHKHIDIQPKYIDIYKQNTHNL